MPSHRRFTTVELDDDLVEKLRQIGEASDRSVPYVIKFLLTEVLKDFDPSTTTKIEKPLAPVIGLTAPKESTEKV